MDALARFRLDGKVAAIAGAASGLCSSVADLLARAGADLALIDRDVELGQAAAERAGGAGRRATFYGADLRDPEASSDLVDRIVRDFGRIDVLVSGIGIDPSKDVLEITPQEWREVQDVNVGAMFFACQAFARHMARHGGGSIVAVGAGAGGGAAQPQVHGDASRAAVYRMVGSLAVELAPFRIRVNAVAPGHVLAETTRPALGRREWVEHWEEAVPMKRLAEPDEIAHAVLFLASDAASYCTGIVLPVDGGRSCR